MNVFELADYLGFTAALLGGVLVGRRMRPKPPEPITPVCSCKHGYGTHDNGGKCGAEINRGNKWDADGLTIGYEWTPCPCLRYDGPDPVIFGIEAR